ncbi:MAG: PIG-L family deacetylase [Firmicutes bacterium]|nr:PIG-L family deacetylase [Bacillota bacterium]
MSEQLRILAIGAHPDDCDLKAGGAAIMYAQMGHKVRFVSVTNGDAGHQRMGGAALAKRRREEARRAGQVAGIEYLVLDNHDGELEVNLHNRRQIIALIREFQPDLVMTHRPNDYHPDHRYTSQLVQDAAFMVTVPNIVSEVDHLDVNPVIVYFSDRFRKPSPFTPDVVIDIGPVMEQKVRMLHQHTSQFYEWLPYNGRYLDEVPEGEDERIAWLTQKMQERFALPDDPSYRRALEEWYGAERASMVQYVEAFEACEYGAPLTCEDIPRLFPMLRR